MSRKEGEFMIIWKFKTRVFRCAVFSLIIMSFFVSSPAAAENAGETGKRAPADFRSIEGKWQRPDGGYILELNEIGKDGVLKAAYYNPRPINVFKAEWSHKKGAINVFVELRDFNYPGSKYDLQYDPKTDRLRGTYFQAVHGETYAVEFVRAE